MGWRLTKSALGNLLKAYKAVPTLLPASDSALRCTRYFKPTECKVIIIGQDPYYLRGVPTGLAFDTGGKGMTPALANIYKELKGSYPNAKAKMDGNLESWARQGVLLLNTHLVVEENKPLSGRKWQTDVISCQILLQAIAHNPDVVVMLWGKEAQNFYTACIKRLPFLPKNVLFCGHPSPLNRITPFVGSGIFNACDDILLKQGKEPIQWLL
jgi:uracil-DNA glycosylase